MTVVAMAIAGAVGALARFEVASAVARRLPMRSMPLGTLLVNVVGAFAAGWVFSADPSEATSRIVATGFLGGFTTFSTWMSETAQLAEEGRSTGLAMANLGLMSVAGLAGAAVVMA